MLAAEAGTDLHDALTEIAGDRHSFKSIDARKLGRWIAAHRGTRSGGLYIEQREQSEKSKTSARWYVCSEHSAHSGVDVNSENPENTHARYH